MEEISRSVHQDKQTKFWDAKCTCPYSPYSPYDDVAGPYRPYGGDVAATGWLFVGEYCDDTCHIGSKWYEDTWPNAWVPRVPRWLVYICYVKTNGGCGVRPPDLPQHKPLQYSINH
jgi:hypothetical protein